MRYLLSEFLGVFFLIYFSSLANISFANKLLQGANCLLPGFVTILFAASPGQPVPIFFSPSFVLVQTLWKALPVSSSIGYLTAQLIAAFFATSMVVLCLPYTMTGGYSELDIGWRNIDGNNDFFVVFTVEVVGTFLMFGGYLYFSSYDFTLKARSDDVVTKRGEGAFKSMFYYGILLAALSVSSYKISGGAYNLAMVLSAIVFKSSLDSRLFAMFIGNFVGAVVAKMVHLQVLGPKAENKQNKTLNLLLNR